MALDPRVIAALSAGAKTSSVYQPGDYATQKTEGAWNLGQGIIDILSTGGYATAGLTSKLGQNVAAIGRGEIGAALDLVNPFSGVSAMGKGVAERRTYSENLKDMGVDPNASIWLGLALDIGLDPTTYLTGGTLAGAKGAVQGAKLAGQATRAGKVAAKPAEAAAKTETFIPIDRPLTQEEKLGNLLTGISRGYSKGKANYKSTVTANKLDRMTRKAEREFPVIREAVEISPLFSAADAAAVASVGGKIAAKEQQVAKAQAKLAKQGKKAAEAKKKAEEIDIQVSAGLPKPKAVESPDELNEAAQKTKEDLASASSVLAKLNSFAQGFRKPGASAAAADLDNFAKAKADFSDAAFDFTSQELADLTGSSAKFGAVKTDLVKRYVNAAPAVKAQEKNKEIYERILAAPANISDDFIELQEELVGLGAKLNAITVDDLLYASTVTKSKTVRQQALDAIDASKAALDDIASIDNLTSKPWIEGIITSNDAGDAARAIVDWISPALRESNPAIFKTFSAAIEKELSALLAKAAEAKDAPLSAQQIEEVIGKLLDDGIGGIIAKIPDSEFSSGAAIAANYNDIGEMAADLQSGRLKKLSAEDKRVLSSILGVPESKVRAAVIKSFANVDTHVSVVTGEPVAAAAVKGAESTGDALLATGNAAGDDVGTLLDEATDNSPAALERVFDESREEAARRYLEVVSRVPAKERNQFEEKMVGFIRDSFLTDELKVIDALAKRSEVSRNEIIAMAIAGDLEVIKELGKQFTTSGAVKITEASSAGRIGIFTRVMDLRKEGVYKGLDDQAIANRESLYFSAVEELLRSMGIPVRSTETKAAALLRQNIKPRSKAAKTVVPEYSSVTWADIVTSMVAKGQSELAYRLRKIRGPKSASAEIKLGNFLPTSIEGAWLAVKRLKVNNEEIVKGTANYDEVTFALNNIVKPGGDVVEAPHVLAATKLKGAEAGEIARTSDDIIEFLINNYDELKVLDDTRETLLAASVGKEIYPEVSNIFVRLLGWASEMVEIKEITTAAKSYETAVRIGEEEIGELFGRYESLIRDLATGYRDPEMAKHMFGLHTSVLINQSWNIPAVNRRLVLGQFKAQAQIIAETVQTTMAMQKATAGKTGKAAQAAGKNARNQQAVAIEKRRDAITAEVSAKNAVPTTEELADNAIYQKGHIDAAMAQPQGWWQKFMVSFDPNYGMGAAIRQMLTAKDTVALTWTGLLNTSMQAVARAYRGREVEVNAAFKALQAYKKEAIAAAELNRTLSVDEFLTSAGLDVNREMFNDLEVLMKGLFGDMGVFGAAKGSKVMPEELGIALAQLGLGNDLLVAIKKSEGSEDVFKVFENFWVDMNMAERNVFAWLEGVNLAVGRAASYTALGARFSSTLGKNVDELKAAGEDLTKWKKIDPEAPGITNRIIGDSDLLFHEDDLKKLAFVERQLQYGDPLSDGSLKNFIELSDRIVYVLKTTQTLLRPGHWAVSIIGEAAMNMLAGANKVRYYNNSVRILNKFRFGQYNNEGEPFKALAELSAAKGKRINVEAFDNVAWVDGNAKRIIPDEAVFQLAFREGVLMNPFSAGGGIEDFLVTNKNSIEGLYGGYHKAMNKLGTGAAYRDNFFRMAHFIHELENVRGAASLEEAARIAAKRIQDWHPNSANLTAFEKSYARRAVYFYTWQKVAAVTIIGWMIQNPGKATILPKSLYAWSDANGFNPESFGDPWDPSGIYASWHTGQIYGPQFRSEGTFGDVVGIQPAIQPLDIVGQLAKPFSLQPGQNPLDSVAQGANDMFAANLNPLVKILMESTAQSRLGEGGDLPSPSEYLIGQVGVLSTLSKVTGIGQDPNPYETPQEKEEKNNRLWFNFFTGQRIQDYNTPATQYKWTLDQQEIMRRMAE